MDASFVILVAFVVASSGFELTSDSCNVENADCVTTCTCHHGYAHENEACLAMIGTSCTNSEQCVNGASCVNDKCACPDDHVPHGNNTSCLEKVGTPCQQDDTVDCIYNALCTSVSENETVCQCKDGYTAFNDNTLCSGDVGATCDSSIDCTRHALCTGEEEPRECTCRVGYSPGENNSTCLGKVNSQCEGRDCIAHASCVELDGSRVCECNVGFVRNAAGDQCLAKVGTDCSGGVPCLGNGTCDVTAELCECVAGHSPNSDYSICGVNVQGTCNVDSDCVQYAVCNEGTCACDVGFKGPETCVKIALGDNCTMLNDCKHVKHAVCAEKQCACAATYTQQDNVCSGSSRLESLGSLCRYMILIISLLFSK